ncbi:MAG: hypothetical protein AMXMBFR47_13100 [Planctomycetota bacterium]
MNSDYPRTAPFVPWEPRPAGRFTGLNGLIAGLAVGLYRVAKPIVVRLPGVIALVVTVAICFGAWIVSDACRAVHDVRSAMAAAGLPATDSLTFEMIGKHLPAGVASPVALVWLMQASLVRDLFAIVGILGLVSVVAVYSIWGERKVSAFLQSRLGPMRVGGWNGWAQTFADGLKLVAKEDLIPDSADKFLFRLAPYLSFVPALAALIAVPFGFYWIFRDFDAGLLIVLALLAVDIIGVLLGGWASNNKWSVFGALREACQVVSYEIPMGLALLVPIMIVGSLRFHDYAEAQAGGWFNWLVFHSPWAFSAALIYFIASLASCKRAPFDLPEAESELVAGFHTEYSGYRWSIFFFAEYAAMFVVSAVMVMLFLGGWDSPWAGLMPKSWETDRSPLIAIAAGVIFTGPLWFMLKCVLLIFTHMWLRWTLPRLRIDQVLYAGLQVMLPLTIVILLLSAVWELAVGTRAEPSILAWASRIILGGLGLACVIAAVATLVLGYLRGREIVGKLAVDRPLRGA